MNKQATRIKDIAQLAGVSEGTVDRVLHNRGKVSKSVAEKVLRVINSTDYKPNLIARTLGSNKTYRIAALVPRTDDPYWSQSAIGLDKAALEWEKYGIIVERYYFNHHDKNSFLQKSLELYHAKPDGVLAAPLFYYTSIPFFKVLKENKIPYVHINTYIPEVEPLNFIGQNSFQSGELAAELLYYGHRSTCAYAIVHIYQDIENAIQLIEKEKGFKSFFQSLKDGDNKVISLNLNRHDLTQFTEQLELLLATTELKGIFVSTSKAYLIAEAIEKTGRKDIRLVGYDLIDENLRYLKAGKINALINQNPKRQALVGINNLANYLVFKKETTGMNLFPLEIITRQNLASYLDSDIH